MLKNFSWSVPLLLPEPRLRYHPFPGCPSPVVVWLSSQEYALAGVAVVLVIFPSCLLRVIRVVR